MRSLRSTGTKIRYSAELVKIFNCIYHILKVCGILCINIEILLLQSAIQKITPETPANIREVAYEMPLLWIQ